MGIRPIGLTVLAAAGLTTAGAVALRARTGRKAVSPGSGPLAVYLQNHLAGARMAVELLGAVRDLHTGEPMAQFAETLLAEIDEDRAVLREIIQRTDAGQGMPAPRSTEARGLYESPTRRVVRGSLFAESAQYPWARRSLQRTNRLWHEPCSLWAGRR